MLQLEAPLAIVDLETTGGHPAWDRVTEIGVLEVDGFELSSEWSTLVNPGTAIPAPIQALTGITNEMVSSAPSFAELAAELYERLAGRVFVAHNARFDYGFLRHEFERAGLRFLAKTLCTVRLSRRLYPGQASHNLDSLIARHGIDCRARHRALGDADAVWQFLRHAALEHGDEIVAVAARQVARQPALPPHIDRALIDAIPEAPGVYVFHGEGGAPLYVGMSRSMRSRVLRHFSSNTHWAPQVANIDWQRTAGELGARLREARLVKELSPAYNRRRAAARARLEPPDWPHPGPLGIVERDRARDETEVHVVDRWRHLGTARSDAELAELLEAAREARFDYDHYRILARHLGSKGVRILRLTRCTAS
jgi:DNA polymerase III subunit epsilon